MCRRGSAVVALNVSQQEAIVSELDANFFTDNSLEGALNRQDGSNVGLHEMQFRSSGTTATSSVTTGAGHGGDVVATRCGSNGRRLKQE